jgi:hypothetical protein
LPTGRRRPIARRLRGGALQGGDWLHDSLKRVERESPPTPSQSPSPGVHQRHPRRSGVASQRGRGCPGAAKVNATHSPGPPRTSVTRAALVSGNVKGAWRARATTRKRPSRTGDWSRTLALTMPPWVPDGSR